jgi:hypothetical protein
MQGPPRKSGSCLGDVGKLFILLVLVAIGYLVVIAVFAPWVYYLGGNFHLMPYWQGWGTLQAPSGNFTLYVFLSQPELSRLHTAGRVVQIPARHRFVLQQEFWLE